MNATPNAWRCFHCDEVFTSSEAAAEHFGPRIFSDPACTIDAARLRELESELARYREEDTDLHREIHGLHAANDEAVRRAEEQGYERGLRDGMAAPKRPDDYWLHVRGCDCAYCTWERHGTAGVKTVDGGQS